MKLPQKFEKRMKNMLGDEYADFINSMDETPIFTGIRTNTSKEGSKEAVLKEFGNLENVPWCENGFYADKSVISGNHPYHIAGLFYFQEPSAMSTVSALPIEKDDFILDLCAAPGGKATQAGAFLGKDGLLVANEIIKNRSNILSDNIERFGLTNAVVTNETPQTLLLLSDDDRTVPPENSIFYYNALKMHGVKASMHIYPTGGHGWGIRDRFKYKSQWQEALLDWLSNLK